AAAIGVVLHSFSRRFGVCCLGGAALCSALHLFYEAWSAGFRVNLGWGPPMFVLGFVVALPVCLVVGLPFRFARRLGRRDAEPCDAAGVVMRRLSMLAGAISVLFGAFLIWMAYGFASMRDPGTPDAPGGAGDWYSSGPVGFGVFLIGVGLWLTISKPRSS